MDGNTYRMYVWREEEEGEKREIKEEDWKEGKEEREDGNRKKREMRMAKKKKEGSGRVMSLSLLNSHIYTISIMCLG